MPMDPAPLLVTADEALATEMRRLAAAAGTAMDHETAITSPVVAAGWRRAPLIVLDPPAVMRAADMGLSRRDRVLVASSGELDAAQWKACLAAGATRVVDPARDDADLLALLAEATPSTDSGAMGGSAVAVVGAVGGAGATVFAIAVGLALQRAERQAVLVGLDPFSPSLDVAAGIESVPGARWPDVAAPGGRLTADALHSALPAMRTRAGAIPVLGPGCGARASEAPPGPVDSTLLDTVTDAVRRSGEDLVLDLPTRPDPAAHHAAADADVTVIVAPSDVRGCYGAAQVAGRLRSVGATLGLVVRGPSPGGLGAGDIADATGLPLVAAMRPEPGLDQRIDAGIPPGQRARSPLGRTATALVHSLKDPS